jgi:hypothetical protein
MANDKRAGRRAFWQRHVEAHRRSGLCLRLQRGVGVRGWGLTARGRARREGARGRGER